MVVERREVILGVKERTIAAGALLYWTNSVSRPGVATEPAIGVTVAESVTVTVRVGVAVSVSVAVGVSVFVNVTVGVAVDVGADVPVGAGGGKVRDGVGVGSDGESTEANRPPTTMLTTTKRASKLKSLWLTFLRRCFTHPSCARSSHLYSSHQRYDKWRQ